LTPRILASTIQATRNIRAVLGDCVTEYSAKLNDGVLQLPPPILERSRPAAGFYSVLGATRGSIWLFTSDVVHEAIDALTSSRRPMGFDDFEGNWLRSDWPQLEWVDLAGESVALPNNQLERAGIGANDDLLIRIEDDHVAVQQWGAT